LATYRGTTLFDYWRRGRKEGEREVKSDLAHANG